MEGSRTGTIRARVNKKIDSFAQGGLNHATGILSALWGIMNGDVEIPPALKTLPAVSPSNFAFSLLLQGSIYLAESAPTGHEPRPLGCCEGRAHKVHPYRCIF